MIQDKNCQELFQDVHKKQLEMLEKFSHHVRVNKIDEKYREQYLDTIRQLVAEQVRTQTYITRLASERDGLMGDITKLTGKLNTASMDLVEEEVNTAKLHEKVKMLEEKIFKLQSESRGSEARGPELRFSETEEYRAVMEDMQRLLAHREEITQMKKVFKQKQDDL